MTKIRFVGLDVHAETIAVAVADGTDPVRSLGVIPNRAESLRKLMKKLGPPEQLRTCYEAGPRGYVVHWQLTGLGVLCEVVAPTLVPVKPGDRVKTDRRDAEKLARSYRAGDLTLVWVPDEAHEAPRDLVRAREAAKKDQLRSRHRLGKFLLRHGRRPPTAIKAWTQSHLQCPDDMVRATRFGARRPASKARRVRVLAVFARGATPLAGCAGRKVFGELGGRDTRPNVSAGPSPPSARSVTKPRIRRSTSRE
jgi:transposase